MSPEFSKWRHRLAAPEPNPFLILSPTPGTKRARWGLIRWSLIVIAIIGNPSHPSISSSLHLHMYGSPSRQRWKQSLLGFVVILSGFVVRFLMLKCASLRFGSDPRSEKPNPSLCRRIAVTFCSCDVSAVISFLFKFVCLFLSLCVIMRIFQLSSARRRHTRLTAVECFRPFESCNYGTLVHL